MRIASYIFKAGKLFGRINIKRHPFKKMKQLFVSGIWSSKFCVCGANFRINYPIKFIYGAEYMHIGDNVSIHPGVRLEAIKTAQDNPVLKIGNNVGLGFNTQINAINKIIIGNNVLFGSNIYITDHNHGKSSKEELLIPPTKRILYSKGSVIIGDNCWIGQNVSIMPDVNLGINCIVGANSVVTHSFPANSVIAGCPAKLIKTIQ